MPVSALDALLRERAALAPLRHATPLLWALLDDRISAAERGGVGAAAPFESSAAAAGQHATAEQSVASVADQEDPSYTSQLAALQLHAGGVVLPSAQSYHVPQDHALLARLPHSAPVHGAGASAGDASFASSYGSMHGHSAGRTPQSALHTLAVTPRGATTGVHPGAGGGTTSIAVGQHPHHPHHPHPHPHHQHQPHVHHQSGRKRVKLPVPAEKYPEYNFVGRLLGPRGTTLKTLERDTGCKIMIRGKGSIRKDKEADVRGKPGWEHVFAEPLHVVIEVADAVDDADATRALIRAKEAVELLLVPVPEERDGLKRQQLRDLAILNGTFRGAAAAAADAAAASPAPGQAPGPSASAGQLGLNTCAPGASAILGSGPLQRMCHSALPSTTVASSSISPYGLSQSGSPATTPSSSSAGPHALHQGGQGHSLHQHLHQQVHANASHGLRSHGGTGQAVSAQHAQTNPQQSHQPQLSASSSSSSGQLRQTAQRTLSSASSSCTVASSPPPCAAWGPPNGGALFGLDALGHGFLGESAAASSYHGLSSAPPPRVDFVSCSSADDDDEQDPVSSCGTSLEGGDETGGNPTVSPESSAMGLVFMGADFYNGAFSNKLTSSDPSAASGVCHASSGVGGLAGSTGSTSTSGSGGAAVAGSKAARLAQPWTSKAQSSSDVTTLQSKVTFDSSAREIHRQQAEA